MRAPVFLFPGQGSQYIGMGRSFCDSRPAVARLFDEGSDAIGKNLRQLCFAGPEATLVQTDNVQPAITIVNVAVFEVLREEGLVPSAAAGHSLGEYAALYAAGVLTFADTMKLVQFRGSVMKAAADRHAGGMTAVIGLDVETLTAICGEVRDVGSVEVANHNSPKQVALTGDLEALKRAAELAKQKGAKLTVPLKVSGAWHSRFMNEAKDQMKDRLAQVAVGRPRFPVISNVTAGPHPDDPDAIRGLLVEQVVSPVRWSTSIDRLAEDPSQVFVEAGPGKVLTGLLRDINREAKCFSVQDADGLAKLLAFRSESAVA